MGRQPRSGAAPPVLAARSRRSPPMLPAVKTYDVQLVQTDGKSGAGKYESPTGELPDVGDLIEVDQHGTRARVTDVWPDDNPPIRAELFDA
jgi:hypothetical protein